MFRLWTVTWLIRAGLHMSGTERPYPSAGMLGSPLVRRWKNVVLDAGKVLCVLCVLCVPLRGGFIFRSRGPSLKVHCSQGAARRILRQMTTDALNSEGPLALEYQGQ
jgi:hypothetical protein